jgi:hypothetical protein
MKYGRTLLRISKNSIWKNGNNRPSERSVQKEQLSGGICSMDVVITAGTKRKPDEQRTDLIKRNLAVMKDLSE